MPNNFNSTRFSVTRSESIPVDNVGDWVDIYILRDKRTGVNYLLAKNGDGGGLTPLLNQHGYVITS